NRHEPPPAPGFGYNRVVRDDRLVPSLSEKVGMTPFVSPPVRHLLVCSFSLLVIASLLANGYLLSAQQPDKTPPAPVPVTSGTAKLNADNTRIEFVGLHTGRDPRPRLGGFKKFDGLLVVDQDVLKK